MPTELYTIEEALKIVAGAMKALQTPGLSKTEIIAYAVLAKPLTYIGKVCGERGL